MEVESDIFAACYMMSSKSSVDAKVTELHISSMVHQHAGWFEYLERERGMEREVASFQSINMCALSLCKEILDRSV